MNTVKLVTELIEALKMVYERRTLEEDNDPWVCIEKQEMEDIGRLIKKAEERNARDEH